MQIFKYLAFEADRKKTKFENNLDDMLFGGGPPKRRPAPQPAADNANKSV